MDASPSLFSRAGRLLRAKRFLSFYAIGLYALTVAPPLVVAWLRAHHPLADLVHRSNSPFADVVAAPSVAAIAMVVATLVVTAWFRAGYLRSLVGRLHWRPVDGRQFRRLLALGAVYELIAWWFVTAGTSLNDQSDALSSGRLQVIALIMLIIQIGVSVLLLYVDYAIVISNTTLVGALQASWRTVKAKASLSIGVCLAFALLSLLEATALDAVGGVATHVLPPLFIDVVVMGIVGFVFDVFLVTIYIDHLEHRPTFDADR